MVKLIDKAIVISVKIHKNAGLSFEAGCCRYLTSTLYSAAGYFLCIKNKKMRNPIIIWVCCIKEPF
jgi:hypothetical protein